MPGITFTSYVPTSLVGNNSASPTLAAEVVTGLPIPTGAFPGALFYLNEAQANQLSQTSINSAPLMACHAGWYMVVQVDAGATSANIVQGAIGAQKAISKTNAVSQQGVPVQAIVTDASNVLSLGQNPVVFLNAVTPGNYTIVQVQGDGHVLLAASQTVAAGELLQSTSAGTVDVVAGGTDVTATIFTESVGVAEETFNSPAGALTLSSVAAASAGSAVYTGTITGGTTPNYVGQRFVITGFTGAAAVNNGTYLCTACSTTTLTLSNPNAVAVTAAGTATAQNLMRTNIKFPFGVV
jgi:hypothetical protein